MNNTITKMFHKLSGRKMQKSHKKCTCLNMYTIRFMYFTSLQDINMDNGYLNNTFLTN